MEFRVVTPRPLSRGCGVEDLAVMRRAEHAEQLGQLLAVEHGAAVHGAPASASVAVCARGVVSLPAIALLAPRTHARVPGPSHVVIDHAASAALMKRSTSLFR